MEVSIGVVVLISMIILGITLVYSWLIIISRKCPQKMIEYRFIPRTLEEEQDSPVLPSVIFNNVFNSRPLNA